MPLFGVDVSSFQGAPDYAKVKASGVTFVIAKATEGIGYTDPQYARNRAAIPAAGLVPGAYHFLRGTSPGKDQADAFTRVADPHAIHALDVECLADVRKLGRKLDVAGFVGRYRQLLPGHPLLIYTGRDFWSACAGGAGNQYGPLWAAGYAPNAYVAGSGNLTQQWAKAGHATSGLPWGGWTTWAICQITDRAVVPGISGGVDGDVFTGTLDQLRALATHTPEDDMPSADEIAAAVWGFPVGGEVEADGKTRTSQAMASQRNYNRIAALTGLNPSVLAQQIAAVLAPQLAAAVKGVAVGTATVDDATIAKIAQAAATELATRLVR